FLCAGLLALIGAPSVVGATRAPRDLRLALIGLAVTAALGLALALALGRGLALPVALPTLVDLHAAWGWLGWGGILLAATSWVVVPMFQITPGYPPRFSAMWAPAVLAALALWSLARFADAGPASITLGIVLLALVVGFAALTLHLQSRTRRSTPDAPFRSFRSAMVALILGLAALAAN